MPFAKSLISTETLMSNPALSFGTAGVRAAMSWGWSRLNVITITQVSQGLAEYLLAKSPSTKGKGIVVGFDTRHNSRDFAQHAAAVFRRKSIRVYGYQLPVHTPMVPFAVKNFGAVAGVMITASHNPAEDNGYKVYGSNGCQINTPVDKDIIHYMGMNMVYPNPSDLSVNMHLHQHLKSYVDDLYLDTIERAIRKSSDSIACPRFVYTPMHGVGGSMMVKACRRFEYLEQMAIVADQAYPDPDFPTLKFPNPEEENALGSAIKFADREDIHLIIANDPDADRFAAAEKVGDDWHIFTGDEIGILLAEHLMTDPSGEPSYMITTAVSSQRLSVIAAQRGIKVQETLTGFRWIGERTLALEAQGKKVSFAYEEALGYMFPNVVYDKDGITAAIVFLRACKKWRSPFAKLQQLNEEHGYFETANASTRLDSTHKVPDVFTNICKTIRGSTEVAGRSISRCRDLLGAYDSGSWNNLPDLPSGQSNYMITCWLAPRIGNVGIADQGVRFTIRASGTEPKVKYYVECRASSKKAAKDGATEVYKDLVGGRLSYIEA